MSVKLLMAVIAILALRQPLWSQNNIFRLNLNPTLLNSAPIPGSPVDVAMNVSGSIIVVTAERQIFSLTLTGTIIGSPHTFTGTAVPVAVAINDSPALIYVLMSDGTVIRLNTGLNELGTTSVISVPSQTPIDVATDNVGNIYVLSNTTVFKRNSTLTSLASASVSGSGAGSGAGTSVTAGRLGSLSGHVYVTTSGGLIHFNSSLTELNSTAIAVGGLKVDADDAGNIIVASTSSLRKFNLSATLTGGPVTVAGTIVGIDVDDANHVVTANGSGTIFVHTALGLVPSSTTAATGAPLTSIATDGSGGVIAVGGTNLPVASIGAVASTNNNFGSVVIGTTNPTRTFSVANSGDPISVTINSITAHTGCTGCSAYSISPTSFNVPGSFTVTLLSATGTAGNKDATFDINATASGGTVNTPTFTVLATLTAPAPNPQCGGTSPCSTILATADQFLGTFDDFTKVINNTGTAAAQVTTMTISNDVNNEFSIVSGNAAGPISAGGSRTVTIRYTPTPGANHTSDASLVVNFSNASTVTCCFRAQAHHAQPNMLVTVLPDGGTTADYHDVELGFTYTKGVLVQNTGDAPLNFTLEEINTPDPDRSQWSEVQTVTNISISTGSSTTFLARFTPRATSATPYSIELRATGSGGGGSYTSQVNLVLTGNGVNPVPMDNVLVLDRSGSMSESAGSRTKIQALQSAAQLYYDLLRPDPGDGSGDQIGFVKYNQTAEDYLAPLELKSGTTDALVLDKLSDAAVGDVSRLAPGGSTCISCGMTNSANLLAGSPDTRKQVMVVMTDGHETSGPHVTDAFISGLTTANPDMMIYSLGLGDDFDGALLGRITNAGTGGYHQVSGSMLGTNHFALEEFYFKIYANAFGADLLDDPTIPVDLSSGTPVEVRRARVVTSDRSAIFLVLDDPMLSSFYTLEFVDPRGNVLTPASLLGTIPIQVLSRPGYSLYKLIFPDVSQAPLYVGEWILRLVPTGTWKPGLAIKSGEDKVYGRYLVPGESIQPHRGVVPIGFSGAVKSDYNMIVTATASTDRPGADVLLIASLSDRGWPSLGGTIRVTTTRPDNASMQYLLFDDGTHGDTQANDGAYSNVYNQTALKGVYKFSFDGLGVNDRGEMVPRHASRFVSLYPPDPTGTTGDGKCTGCFPCWVYYLFAVLIVLFLIYWFRLRN